MSIEIPKVSADDSARVTRRKAWPTRWVVAEDPDVAVVDGLCRALNVSRITARILVRRGLNTPELADAFLRSDLGGLHDPALLPDIDKATARIEEAVKKKQRVVLFGDYDVDGVSSTALLAGFFKLLGHAVIPMVPERSKGGYGLSAEAVQRILAEKPALLITLDNGVTAREPLDELQSHGVDCIVVDHHRVRPEDMPHVLALIHPQAPGSVYPCVDLCGVGLAFKLAWALAVRFSQSKKVTPEFRAFLLQAIALAALGTIADVVPLRGENRIIVAQGLKALARTQAPGLKALREVCKLEGALAPSDVGFRLAPRINAAGRCGEAAEALELLLSTDHGQATKLAQRLDKLNSERQAIEQHILGQARAQVLAMLKQGELPWALVLGAPEWHPGVIGIVAARLVEEFHRPTVVINIEASGIARGSGRSIKGCDLEAAFSECQAHLLSFGGHGAAAGLSLNQENIDAFRSDFCTSVKRSVAPEHWEPAIFLDEVVTLSEVNRQLVDELERLEPYGMGNPTPTLGVMGVDIGETLRPMGQGEKHLSFMARQDRAALRAVGFNWGEFFNQLANIKSDSELDLCFRPSLNTFRGTSNVEMVLQSFRVR